MNMDEYKSNSHKSKELNKAPEKRVEKVINGPAKVKKKSESKKLVGLFIKDDIENIGMYILTEVMVPAVKRTILDSVKALLGETGSSSRGGTSASKVSYRAFFEPDATRRTPYNSASAGTGFDYDNISYDTRGDAESVLDALTDLVNSQYGVASVADLYDLSNISTDNYMLGRYGWTDLRTAKVMPTNDGYMIKLPRALPLK